ncbi:unnamed protein product [Adineta steineri]|uniref:P2X purinoceptor n=1 Tax=Adineta steineri TaxID=433720 RepID=A0A814DSJ2_9BILA|nr:unnamed protein product [Adineta steineri]CAF0957687.1 unnamed protein product [Adineta steineri]CAF0964384.1 unnamed protein product [Adineta steineri]
MNPVSSSNQRFNVRSFLKQLIVGFMTEYETPKIVMVHSYSITTLLRFIQTILLLYSLCYLLIYRKGYQYQDTSLISSITIKVKGLGYIDTPNNDSYVFDGTDYIIPSSENNAVFIMTNFIETDQSRSTCLESASFKPAKCRNDGDCQNKPYMPDINGRWTGRCSLTSIIDMSNITTNISQQPYGLCEIQGWCPVEDDRKKSTVIREIPHFTIFIKNFIEFPTFNVKHKNMAGNLKPCVFHPKKNTDCPIFGLDYILEEAEKNETERQLMLLYGGVISVKLDWDCNLDRNIKLCKPVYTFDRLDTPFHEERFSIGFNFRFASHWKDNETYLRLLRKAYGLRFIVSVSGKAGKFDFITLTLNTGSLVGIFGLATFLCDYILLNLTEKASMYREQIFHRVNPKETRVDNAFELLKKQVQDKTLIMENPNTNEQHMTPSFRISEPPPSENLSIVTSTSFSSVPVNQNSTTLVHPYIGLTNMMKQGTK